MGQAGKDFPRKLWVGPKIRNMQLDPVRMLGLEIAHDMCENACFSEYSLQQSVANPHSEICTVALSWIYAAGCWNSDSVNAVSMQVSTDLQWPWFLLHPLDLCSFVSKISHDVTRVVGEIVIGANIQLLSLPYIVSATEWWEFFYFSRQICSSGPCIKIKEKKRKKALYHRSYSPESLYSWFSQGQGRKEMVPWKGVY